MTDPFLIQGPAVISFSGGRTSGYMLKRILDAHGGTLPDDVVVAFANTGREMPATLDFVRDCGAAWNVPVVWLEYRRYPETGRVWAEVVSHNSASRAGEPFELMLAEKQMLPNPVMRFCTQELKIRTIKRHVRETLGWANWTSVIGIRADEPQRLRIAREAVEQQDDLLLGPVKPKKRRGNHEPWTLGYPLADAGIRLADVRSFWAEQSFDLGLAGTWEGNCDGCFLKSKAAIQRMQHDHPERMRWWPRAETLFASTVRTAPSMNLFRADREPYAVLAQLVADMPRLPFDETMIEGGEACGAWCGV